MCRRPHSRGHRWTEPHGRHRFQTAARTLFWFPHRNEDPRWIFHASSIFGNFECLPIQSARPISQSACATDMAMERKATQPSSLETRHMMVHQNRELLFNKTCVVLFLASVTRSVAESIIAVRLGVPLPLAPVCAVSFPGWRRAGTTQSSPRYSANGGSHSGSGHAICFLGMGYGRLGRSNPDPEEDTFSPKSTPVVRFSAPPELAFWLAPPPAATTLGCIRLHSERAPS